MVDKTVTWVGEDASPIDTQFGTLYYVNGKFGDGDSFSIGKKDRNAALDIRSELFNLIDQEGDYTLEDTGKKNNDDMTKWKLKGWPGHDYVPYQGNAPSGSPAPSSGAPVAHNGASRDDAISRAVALKAAATLWSGTGEMDKALHSADDILKWLTGAGPSSPPGDAATVTGAGGVGVASEPSAPPISSEAGNGDPGGVSAPASDDYPFSEGTEEAGFWNALVFAKGTAKEALKALNSVPGVKPPFDMRNLGFANAKDLMAALEKVESA